MNIDQRLRRLESQLGAPVEADEGTRRLWEYLKTVEDRLSQAGDTKHNPNDSRCNNLARAFLRGDLQTAISIIQELKGLRS